MSNYSNVRIKINSNSIKSVNRVNWELTKKIDVYIDIAICLEYNSYYLNTSKEIVFKYLKGEFCSKNLY